MALASPVVSLTKRDVDIPGKRMVGNIPQAQLVSKFHDRILTSLFETYELISSRLLSLAKMREIVTNARHSEFSSCQAIPGYVAITSHNQVIYNCGENFEENEAAFFDDLLYPHGAYEYQGIGMSEFIGWLAQYALPTDGSADLADPDSDSMTNWQEWQAATDPTNAVSVFRIAPVLPGSPIAITVSSSLGRLYSLFFCADLSAPTWLPVPGQTDIPGTGGALTLIDTNPPAPAFYRVSVRFP